MMTSTAPWGPTTYHDRFLRCPVCGHSTVGLDTFAINHAADCDGSMVRTPEQDSEVTRLLREYDRAAAQEAEAAAARSAAISRKYAAQSGLAELGVDVEKIRG